MNLSHICGGVGDLRFNPKNCPECEIVAGVLNTCDIDPWGEEVQPLARLIDNHRDDEEYDQFKVDFMYFKKCHGIIDEYSTWDSSTTSIYEFTQERSCPHLPFVVVREWSDTTFSGGGAEFYETLDEAVANLVDWEKKEWKKLNGTVNNR